MITTESFCCCINLRVGCLIIGWCKLIFSGIALTSAVSAKVVNSTTNSSADLDPEVKVPTDFWSGVVILTLQIVVAICLLYGVYANRKRCIYYFLFAQSAIALIVILSAIMIVIFGSGYGVAAALSVEITYLIIVSYVLVVVYSYYVKM